MPKKLTKEKFYKGFQIIGKYLRPYKNELIALSVLGIFSAVANAGVPYLVGRLIDAIIEPSVAKIGTISISFAFIFLFVWIILQIISAITERIIGLKSDKIGELLHSGYMAQSFGFLLELSISFHKKKRTGEVTEKLRKASGALSQITSNVLIRLAPQFLSIIVAFILAFSINIILAFILIAGVLIYIFIAFNLIQPIAQMQRKMFKLYQRAYGRAHDAVYNVQEIKQASAENYEKERIRRSFIVRAAQSWFKISRIWQNLSFSQRVIIIITQLIVFIISISFILNGKMTVGALVMFNGYAAILFGPFVTLSRQWQTVQNGLIALEEAEKVLKAPTEIYTPKDIVKLKEIKGDISFQNVSFYYEKEKPVLKNISFDIKKGNTIALVGRSGEGKSTLVDLVSGYYFPINGEILIDGHNIKKIGLEFLRSRIAVVSQEPVLFNDTIEKNVKYGSFRSTRKEIEEAARKAYVSEFVNKFPKRWKQIVGERGIKLSSGQKQRVAIARAILRDPKILILDEPTSALDAHSEQHIQESLEQLMKGRTTFIIAHRLSTVRRADKIIVLKGGKIIEVGKHDELIKKEDGEYRHLYDLQIGLHE